MQTCKMSQPSQPAVVWNFPGLGKLFNWTYGVLSYIQFVVRILQSLSWIWYCKKLHTFWGKILFTWNIGGVKQMTFCKSDQYIHLSQHLWNYVKEIYFFLSRPFNELFKANIFMHFSAVFKYFDNQYLMEKLSNKFIV